MTALVITAKCDDLYDVGQCSASASPFLELSHMGLQTSPDPPPPHSWVWRPRGGVVKNENLWS